MTNQLPHGRPLRQQFLRLLFGGVGGKLVVLGIGLILCVYWQQIVGRSWRPPIRIANLDSLRD